MIITCLIENTNETPTLTSEHGLSLYIEGHGHKVLFDTGLSGAFIDNAKKLGVDIEAVDTLILSHGHNDHGGGLSAFLDLNKGATIYMSDKAFGLYYSKRPDGSMKYIGLDRSIIGNDRIRRVGQREKINDCLEVFSNTSTIRPKPFMNKHLYEKKGNTFYQDRFDHEINLKITYGDKGILMAGCAHNGIENIIETYKGREGSAPDVVIGGFHLSSSSRGLTATEAELHELGTNLLKTKAEIYTCHCTGVSGYKRLKEEMGDKISYLSAGATIQI